MIQMTAPTRDRIRATKANGRPSKNPNGLQSPISYKLFLIFLLRFKYMILAREEIKKEIYIQWPLGTLRYLADSIYLAGVCDPAGKMFILLLFICVLTKLALEIGSFFILVGYLGEKLVGVLGMKGILERTCPILWGEESEWRQRWRALMSC